jgi:hypothetical protein
MLLAPYQSMTFPGEGIVTDNIMTAIEAKDITTLTAMISLERQKTMEDLPGNIGKLIDSIDGEIIGYDWFGSSIFDESNLGKRVSRRTWDIRIETTTGSYRLGTGWVVINNRAPNEVGMLSMSLFDSEGILLATTYVPKT